MLFNSFSFAIFLPIAFTGYWLCPSRYRWAALLALSYYFYMSWSVKYLSLIIITTAVTYGAALLMERYRNRRRLFLLLALTVCLGILFVFKYLDFTLSSVGRALSLVSVDLELPALGLLLPVGISFYTFQTLGYVIDVYRGEVRAERHIGKYALFVSFFPQVVSGPIGRAGSLMPQLEQEHSFDYGEAVNGVKQMAWGFFEKLVIADALAVYVDKVYDYPTEYSGFAMVLTTLFYTIQIYCDFAGYSNIAIGTARLFGIRLMRNFASPYFSSSVREFWSRWHISLSSWFRDYLYIPLGGNRVKKARLYFNLMVVFLLSGLWHGASWTFVVWGGLHGLAQIIERLLDDAFGRQKRFRALRTAAVFIFCSVAWLFFRSHSISDAVYILKAAPAGIGDIPSYLSSGFAALELDGFKLLSICLPLAILSAVDHLSLKTDVIAAISKRSAPVRYALYFALTVLILCFGFSGETTFVYFQF